MNLIPLLDRVLRRRMKKEDRTPGGLAIPDDVGRLARDGRATCA
jgi:co-chaperonin GroES (HSP10)